MADCTLVASVPHIVFRSPGLCSVLTAAMRHAGGVAAITLEERARSERRIVDFMVKILIRCFGVLVIGAFATRDSVDGWKRRVRMNVGCAKERLG